MPISRTPGTAVWRCGKEVRPGAYGRREGSRNEPLTGFVHLLSVRTVVLSGLDEVR